MKKQILAIMVVAMSLTATLTGFAQQGEKGTILKKPNIKPNQKDVKDKNFNKSLKKDDEFDFAEEPKLRFLHEFEPSTPKPEETPAAANVANAPSIPIATPAISTEAAISSKVEPLKELNNAVHEDTSTLDEGLDKVQVVEIEEMAQFPGSDDMVKIASYFSVWDTDNIDPYRIDAKDFEDVVPLQLYDISAGRYWAGPLNRGKKSSPFGWRWKRWHTGTDLPLDTGDPVYAAFDGIVRVASTRGGYGRCIVLRHYNGLETLYGHLSKINYEPNTLVKAGDEIGLGGSTGHSTGPHLHFETRYEGNPFDSENIFNYSPSQINIRSQEFMLTSRVYDYLRGGATKDSFEFEDEQPTNVVQVAWIRTRPGDTLNSIADKFNITAQELCKLNKIKTTTRLKTGYRLRVK